MASLIPGFEYDIFISYRQKDNKGDMWVSGFVNALKDELESTFKEEIGVYFDVNPHDGLLETHDVDESLKEKLKCLVFIPIFSRTYCDPKSFAWEHEFIAFVENASHDQLGLRVKLPGGNVSSRVLPVRIHDLDNEDIKLCESILGGVLRGIEFIYKEPGVNRPLTQEDEVKTNLNKTRYRNQINKIALAIKEIITAARNPNQQYEEVSKSDIKSTDEFEKSIAVLPFINDSPDEENSYFINGLMEEILNKLQSIKELRVISRTSVEKYRIKSKSITEISEELGVNYVVEGSGQKYGNDFRLRVQLIKAAKESHLWAKSYQGEIKEVKDIFNLQSQIAEAIAGELNAAITPQEKNRIEKVPTDVTEAYDAYIMGRHNWRKFTPGDLGKAMEYFKIAVEKDKNFALAYLGIHDVWFGFLQLGFTPPSETDPFGKYMQALTKAQELDSSLAEVHYSLANMYASFKWDWQASEQEYEKALIVRPNYSDVYAAQSNLYAILERTGESLEKGKIALSLDPYNIFNRALYGASMMFARKPNDAISIFESILKTDPNNFLCRNALPLVFHSSGRYTDGLKGWKLFVTSFYNHSDIDIDSIFKDENSQDGYSGILNRLADDILKNLETVRFDIFNLALMYACAGNKVKSLEMLVKCFEDRNPNTPFIVNPVFDIISNEAGYIDLRKKMNLPKKKL